MKINLGLFHNLTGMITLAAFLGTGVYMLVQFPAIEESKVTIKFMFKANHIYILLSGLLNLVLGAYFLPNEKKGDRIAQMIGSALIIPATFLLIFAFFHEPKDLLTNRPITAPAMLSMVVGVLIHWLSSFGKSGQTQQS